MTASYKEPLIQVRGLEKVFRIKGGMLEKKQNLRAVRGVSFDIMPQETFGLVGESGCGKSTTGRLILQLLRPTGGEVLMEGKNLASMKGRALKEQRAKMQMVFQDPYASFDPRQNIYSAVSEPMVIYGLAKTKRERREKVAQLLADVGLNPDAMEKCPHEFSGGQRQRIGIARALALHPQFMVLDEPVSALDVSIQAQVINLLLEMKSQYGLTYLFISHDLSVIKYICDRVAVMYLGEIIEMADKETLFAQPLHPYSQALLAAAPKIGEQRTGEVLTGEVPSPIRPPKGCAFHPRCPHARECCKQVPPVQKLPDGRLIACWLYA